MNNNWKFEFIWLFLGVSLKVAMGPLCADSYTEQSLCFDFVDFFFFFSPSWK